MQDPLAVYSLTIYYISQNQRAGNQINQITGNKIHTGFLYLVNCNNDPGTVECIKDPTRTQECIRGKIVTTRLTSPFNIIFKLFFLLVKQTTKPTYANIRLNIYTSQKNFFWLGNVYLTSLSNVISSPSRNIICNLLLRGHLQI